MFKEDQIIIRNKMMKFRWLWRSWEPWVKDNSTIRK